MGYDLKGKTALVTGGSRGIGKEIAIQMAQAGASVIVHYNQNCKAAEDTLEVLEGNTHIKLSADLSDPDEAAYLADTAVKKMGKVDILVNNAGIYMLHPIAEVTYEEWQAQWEQTIFTNLIGTANLSFLIGNHMIKTGGGRIINISSRGAFRGEPIAPAYGASKAGMNSLGQSLAQALAPHNIFVYTIAPGYVQTDMAEELLVGQQGVMIRAQSPLNRVAQPLEIARTALFLASDECQYMTGCIIDINGASYLRN